jgi:excisionase family DNA binding protein
VSKATEIDLAQRMALRPAEVVETLGVSTRTLRKWMRDEGLPFMRVDAVILIPRDGLERWMAERVEAEKKNEALVGEILDGFSKST